MEVAISYQHRSGIVLIHLRKMSFGVFPFSKDFCENIGIQSLYCFILSKKNVLLKAVGCRSTIFCFYYFLWSLQQQKCNEIRKIQDFLLRRAKLSTLSRVLLAGDVDLTALQEGMLKVISAVLTILSQLFLLIVFKNDIRQYQQTLKKSFHQGLKTYMICSLQ